MNIACVAHMSGIRPKTLHKWYKEGLSDYPQALKEGTWGEKRIRVADEKTGEVTKEIDVPIAMAENMGSHMTIDGKQIGKWMYTLPASAKTAKIAFMAQTLVADGLGAGIKDYPKDAARAVKTICCDMSGAFRKLCREAFPNAKVAIDRSHVVKHLMDALQTVRRRLKTRCINGTRDTKKQGKGAGESPVGDEKGWTGAEMPERARYKLVKTEAEWDGDEGQMMEGLFERHTGLKKAYGPAQKPRSWYHGRNIGKDMYRIERGLYDWCDGAAGSRLEEFSAVGKMIEQHHDDIANYFLERHTNARAENMNGKIQRFLSNNFGIKERDFSLYRLEGYFS